MLHTVKPLIERHFYLSATFNRMTLKKELKNRAPPFNCTPPLIDRHLDILYGKSKIEQLDVDAEGVENDEDGYKSDVSLDFHP